MCDWEPQQLCIRVWKWKVSIPERDYVWLRGENLAPVTVGSVFQSLKGIMCDWEPEVFKGCTLSPGFNPWKGLCVIESRESNPSCNRFCFNPWKGLCVIESLQVVNVLIDATRFNPWKGLCVIERRVRSPQAAFKSYRFQSLKGIMCDWEETLSIKRGVSTSGFNPWKGLCVIERAETWNA